MNIPVKQALSMSARNWLMPSAAHYREDFEYNAGLGFAAAGHHAEALARFEAALKKAPDDPKVLFALGNTARAIGHDAAAEELYRRILAGEPDRLEALVNLANLLRAGGRAKDAIALLGPATERAPETPELWLTLGSACREAGDAERAAVFYREALRLRPDFPQALGNLADLLADNGAVDEALMIYHNVVAGAPYDAQARLNRAVLRLLKGDLKNGWRDYEYRLRIAGKAVSYAHGLPIWDGKSPRKGLRLLVAAEQGIGDQIMFAGVIPDLAARLASHGGKVILEAEPRLVPLFARSFPEAGVYPCDIVFAGGISTARYGWLEAADGAGAAIPLASLPGILRREISDFPRPHAFLKPDRQERESWRRWLSGRAGPFIGICWRSASLGGIRALQYAPLQAWARFLKDVPGSIVSLQYGAAGEEISELERLSGREVLAPPGLDQKEEIDRTCALISALDAVVTAPTAVSWMSAGLGVPTYKILYNNSWTALGNCYEPFAPACRCIMPKSPGDWENAFPQALEALRRAPA